MGDAAGRALNGERGRPFVIGLALGVPVMVFGVVGLLRSTTIESARNVLAWMVAADLLHDLVLAPVVCFTGLALARITPPRFRPPVRAAVIGTALALAIAYPALRGYGRRTAPGNETVLPLDYPTAVLTVIGVVWAVAALWALARLPRSRHR